MWKRPDLAGPAAEDPSGGLGPSYNGTSGWRKVEGNMEALIGIGGVCVVLALFGGLSKRAAETLREEMQNLGPVRIRDIEDAQDRIIAIISGLAEAGEIVLNLDSDDLVS